MSSPITSTRRFSQYKSRTSGSSVVSSSRGKDHRRISGPNFQTDEAPQKQIWREKLRVQVEKRAKRDRERAHERARSEGASSGAGSEVNYDMDDEDEDSLDDEVGCTFRSSCILTTHRSLKAIPKGHARGKAQNGS